MRTRDFIIGVFFLISFLYSICLTAQSIEGQVTDGLTGEPLNGAVIDCLFFITYTGPDGYYYLDLLPSGNIHFIFGYGDLCPFDTTITIMMGQSIELDVQLYPCPELLVEPLNIEVVLEPNAQSTEIITITNPGELEVEWNATLEIFPPENTDDFLDVQFQYPLTGSSSYAGIECDGEYFYLSDPYNGEISKYTLDGTFVEIFSMIYGIQDLAFDGTYFYAGIGSSTIFQMNFYTQMIVSTFGVSQNVQAIAYDDDEGIFYGYNWDGDIFVFDQSGTLINSAPVGPSGAIYAGFAYDNVSDGGPYLWGYGVIGTNPNSLVQIQLPSLQETGLIINLSDLLPEPLTYSAGGLFSHPDIFSGTWTLGGVVHDEWMWGLELSEDLQTWISIEPTSGVLEPGESEEMNVLLYATTDIIPWMYEAEIQFTTTPDIGSPTVGVIMHFEGYPPIPYPVEASINCVAVDLTWDLSNLYYPPVTFNIYKDGDSIANVSEMYYTDSLVIPEETYEYGVSAVYIVGETWPSPVDIIVPLPDALEPTNLSYIVNDSSIILSWDPPAACIAPDGYNIYMDGVLLGFTGGTSLQLPIASHEYFITAVYYFGESLPSNIAVIITTSETKDSKLDKINIFPNPTKGILFIQSPFIINQIEIFDSQGDIVNLQEFGLKSIQLNVSLLEPGIYFLKLKTENEVILKKVTIM